MSVALVIGVGAVGTRAARQLVDTEGIDEVLLADEDDGRVRTVAEALGPRARVVAYAPGGDLPGGVAVVACALPSGDAHRVVASAIEAGVPLATSDDDHETIDELRGLDPNARAAGVTVAVGCGLAPGLADVLVKHGSALFASVDEIRVARIGWAGPACVAAVRHQRRALVRTWREGTWHEEHPHGDSLVWFPEPIGARDCRAVTGGSALLVDAFPGVPRVSVQLGEPPKRTRFRRRFGDDGAWGAARVEIWGKREHAYDCVVYGVVERTEVAAGGVLAVTAASLAGVLGPSLVRPGVHGLGALVEPVSFLGELSKRGVRAAVFEGAPVA